MMNGPENLHFLSFTHKFKEPAQLDIISKSLSNKKVGTSDCENASNEQSDQKEIEDEDQIKDMIP